MRELERARQDFTAMLPHDIRGLLTVITGAVNLLRELGLCARDPDVDEITAMAERNADEILRMITSLLDLYRIEDGKAPLVQAPGKLLRAKQRGKPRHHLADHLRRSGAGRLRPADLPVHTLQVVCQHDPGDGQTLRQGHLERITFDLTGDRADEGEARTAIVDGRGEHQGWAPPGLLVAGARIE